uniref:ribonucleoside-diphosphate reductase n=1 Tax=viral metagenome TaxID=1070528 RepID=A0A6C0IF41_9ZZZZ
MSLSMKVLKRNGSFEPISFDKVLGRIRKASKNLLVNPDSLAQQVLARIYDGVKTSEIDELTAQLAASLSTSHPDYGILASRITVSNHQQNTEASFTNVMIRLANQIDPKTEEKLSYINDDIINIVNEKGKEIDNHIDHDRDYLFDYFGFKTLEKSYLLRDSNRKVLERPQHLWMRTSLALWGNDLKKVFETYDYMSQKYFTHATPTLFNAGTLRQQMSSCFLLAMDEDSVRGIYKTLGDCAAISKYAGGIGLHLHNVRARGSLIKGTNGMSNGIVPMLRVFNNTARYIDQGGGRRNGSFAMYLEPWHADVEDFLRMKNNTGAEEERARDLFYALWVPDLFMKRVEKDGMWSLFCPNEAPGLADVVGNEFEALYTKYEAEKRYRKQVKAQKLWFEVLDSQIETGTPYLLYKDAANLKSNQQNLGVIKSSNLCTEILEYSSPEETAVCNLASIGLPTFVKDEMITHNDGISYKEKVFDFEKLKKVVRIIVRNLNKVIDINYYPTKETKVSNMRHRPIGIGVQGLADVFALLKMSWESKEASELNKKIFEHIYYASLETSMELAKKDGPYESFQGSPASKGILQFDMWSVKPSDTLEWDKLKKQVVKHGLRNSLLVAPMPTASTSQILGFNECFEPITTNIYSRRTLAGEFIVINKYLMKELLDMGVWNDIMKQKIIAHNGSIQLLDELPLEMRNRYKTSWELSQKILIDMAADRGAYICQSQSLNLFVADPNYAKLTSMHFYAWKKGLKTGCYYLRTKAPVAAQKFTVEPVLPVDETSDDKKKRERKELLDKLASEYEEESKKAKELADSGEGCLLCSS